MAKWSSITDLSISARWRGSSQQHPSTSSACICKEWSATSAGSPLTLWTSKKSSTWLNCWWTTGRCTTSRSYSTTWSDSSKPLTSNSSRKGRNVSLSTSRSRKEWNAVWYSDPRWSTMKRSTRYWTGMWAGSTSNDLLFSFHKIISNVNLQLCLRRV